MKRSVWVLWGVAALLAGGLLGLGLLSPSSEKPLPVIWGTPLPASQPVSPDPGAPSPEMFQGIAGVVQDREGRPVPFARVLWWVGEESAETYADREGRFSFSSPFRRGLSLLAEAPGYGQGVLLAPVEGRENEIVVGPPAVVSGVVLDEGGAPLAGAEVVLIDEALGLYAFRGSDGGPGRRYFPESVTRSGPDGRFQLQSFRPGVVVVSASGPGRPVQLSRPLQVFPGARKEITFSLAQGRALSVRVVDSEKQPIAGAEVEAVGCASAATTDLSGIARLAALPEEPVFLRVSAPGYVTSTVADKSGGAPLEIVLARPAVVAGEISGAPEGALVLLVPEEAGGDLSSFAPPRPFRLEQGLFRVGGVAPGRYEIWLQTERALRRIGEVAVAEGETREGLRLHLPEPVPALERPSCEEQYAPSFLVVPRQGVLLVRSADARSGVIEGDRILAVDGLPVALLSEEGVWEWRVTDLTGPRGSRVRLTVERPASGEILHLEVSREARQPGC